MGLPRVMVKFSQQDKRAALRALVFEPLASGACGRHQNSVRQHHSYYVPAVLRRTTESFPPADLPVLGQDEFHDSMRIGSILRRLICEFSLQILAETRHLPAAFLNRSQRQVAERAERAAPANLPAHYLRGVHRYGGVPHLID